MNSKRSGSVLTFVFVCLFALMTAFGPSPAQAALEDYTKVKLRALDKITARTLTFIAHVGTTIQYGPLFISIKACRSAPPIENPETATFLQIWQHNAKKEPEWVFSGWMFASSPALSSMNHPIYDVWVLECAGEKVSGDIMQTDMDLNPQDEDGDTPENGLTDVEDTETDEPEEDAANVIERLLESDNNTANDAGDMQQNNAQPPSRGPEIDVEVLEP